MKIVLDTNVLVSGLLSPFQPPGQIVRMVSSGTLQLCYDAPVLDEYEEVLLRPKFSLDRRQVEALLDQIKSDGDLVTAKPFSEKLPDPDDTMFLEVGLSGSARCLVTGNIKHYPASARHGLLVTQPSDFLVFYAKETSS